MQVFFEKKLNFFCEKRKICVKIGKGTEYALPLRAGVTHKNEAAKPKFYGLAKLFFIAENRGQNFH